jgi:hypothetical protein
VTDDSEPRSKRDYAHMWIEIMRRQLRGEHPDGTPIADSPVEEGQLADDTTPDDEERLF